MTDYGLMTTVWFLTGTRKFSLHLHVHTGNEAHLTSNQRGIMEARSWS